MIGVFIGRHVLVLVSIIFFFFCCAGSLRGLFVAACRLLKLRCECSVVWVLELSCCETSGISVPCLGMEPALEGGFLPTGPQGKSLSESLDVTPTRNSLMRLHEAMTLPSQRPLLHIHLRKHQPVTVAQEKLHIKWII